MSSRTAMTLSRLLPRGRSLPESQWTQRHACIATLLWLHVPAIFGFALVRGFAVEHALAECAVPAVAAWAAMGLRGRTARSCAASIGLMASSGMLVHISGGAIEAHFHFFVMVPVVALYEDWPPFGLAIGYVLLHHGIGGTLAPGTVYAHQAGIESPWVWAGIHAAFITGACAASIANWRLHENARVAERELSAQMAHQASHDALTGLHNRRELERQIEFALLSTAKGSRHVLAVIDLDRFKVINDACGHPAGDALLRAASRVISDGVRDHDVVARLGGDEFAVLLLDCPADAGVEIIETIRRAVENLRFLWDGRTWPVTASAGVAAVTDDSGHTLERLLREADGACFAAKDTGRNRVHTYRSDDDLQPQRRTDLQTVAVLREALETGGLELYFQVIQAVGPGKEGRHGELLLRLNHGGTVYAPGSFLPAAERYDLMPAIDRWVVREAIRQLSAVYGDSRTAGDLYAINLSGASLSDSGFCDYVLGELATSGIAPSLLCFEVTETVAISGLDCAQRTITELRAAGCFFALDDFGMGMSSFSYLKNLAVDFVKVDGSFVRNIVSSPADRAVVDAVNRIAHALGMSTIAEYVETADILERLVLLGVDYVQGYEISRPAPLSEHLTRVTGSTPGKATAETLA